MDTRYNPRSSRCKGSSLSALGACQSVRQQINIWFPPCFLPIPIGDTYTWQRFIRVPPVPTPLLFGFFGARFTNNARDDARARAASSRGSPRSGRQPEKKETARECSSLPLGMIGSSVFAVTRNEAALYDVLVVRQICKQLDVFFVFVENVHSFKANSSSVSPGFCYIESLRADDESITATHRARWRSILSRLIRAALIRRISAAVTWRKLIFNFRFSTSLFHFRRRRPDERQMLSQ